jgi:hypothetical protein
MPIFEKTFSRPLFAPLMKFWAAFSGVSVAGRIPFADLVGECVEGQVRVDRARAVADQAGEVVDLARLARLHDDPGGVARAFADQVVVDRGQGEERGDRGVPGVGAAVGKDQPRTRSSTPRWPCGTARSSARSSADGGDLTETSAAA